MNPTNFDYIGGLMFFFLLEDKMRPGRCRSQCKLVSRGWGTCPSWPPKHFLFFGVKLIFVVVVIFFGNVQFLRFVVGNIFRSCSNLYYVIFIWSCELASGRMAGAVWANKVTQVPGWHSMGSPNCWSGHYEIEYNIFFLYLLPSFHLSVF